MESPTHGKDYLEKQLFSAAWNGDLETFKELLPHFKKNIAALKNDRGQSVLYCACRNGRVPIVVELLLLKSMTNAEISKPQGPGESTPLHAAAWGDHPSIVALLLAAEAEPTIPNTTGKIPEEEAGARTLAIFDRFNSGDLHFLYEHIPFDLASKKMEKLSKIKAKLPVKKWKMSLATSGSLLSSTSSLSSSSHHSNPTSPPRSLAHSTSHQIPTIPPTDWFKHITGVPEPQFRKLDKKQHFIKNKKGYIELLNTDHKPVAFCGRLHIQKIGDLLDNITTTTTTTPSDKGESYVPIEIITREDNDSESIRYVDVAYYQANEGSTGESEVVFQVASNFNGIEAINDDIYPDVPSFVEQYIYDRTQGPVASISAGGAAIARVHAAFIHQTDRPEEWAQTKERQLNFLEELSEYFPVNNGYVTLKGTEKQLPDNEEELEVLLKKIHVCAHENVQVTSGHRTPQNIELLLTPKYIDQVFCAAINIHQGESGRFNKTLEKIDQKCQFILDAQYTSAYLSARSRKKKHLYLTLIGGGAFGNSRKWIFNSILKNHLKFANNLNNNSLNFSGGSAGGGESGGLEKVTLLLFRFGELESVFLEELEKYGIPYKLIVYSKSTPQVKKSFLI